MKCLVGTNWQYLHLIEFNEKIYEFYLNKTMYKEVNDKFYIKLIKSHFPFVESSSQTEKRNVYAECGNLLGFDIRGKVNVLDMYGKVLMSFHTNCIANSKRAVLVYKNHKIKICLVSKLWKLKGKPREINANVPFLIVARIKVPDGMYINVMVFKNIEH